MTNYKITIGQEVMILDKSKIFSPTIEKAIAYIEKEPGCTGVTLDDGWDCEIKIEKVA
jgi:hypothetical protein